MSINTIDFLCTLSNSNGIANLEMPGYTVPVRVTHVESNPLKGIDFACKAVSPIARASTKIGAKPIRVIFNPPATIVFWSDDTKTVVKCSGDDEFDQTVGLAMAICKKMYGNNSCYNDIFKKFVTQGTPHKNVLMTGNAEPNIGDRIEFEVKDFGTVAATVQEVTDTEIVYMTDDCVLRSHVNETDTNSGGYDESKLRVEIEEFLCRFPKDLRTKIAYIAPPTYGQMFGHDDWYEQAIEPDDDEQFVLMKKRKNRVADYKDDYSWYWLKNATKKCYSAHYFACVNNNGNSNYNYASNVNGVRLVFRVRK